MFDTYSYEHAGLPLYVHTGQERCVTDERTSNNRIVISRCAIL